MKNVWKKVFQLIMGATGISETLLGLSIIFFASQLQHYLATGILSEPLYLRILGMMDFFIGVTYFQISRRPDYYRILNRGTSFLRLGLSSVFFVEGFWFLEGEGLRMMYQFLAFFDFFLFTIQTLYLRKFEKP
jgi:hypothetical protein